MSTVTEVYLSDRLAQHVLIPSLVSFIGSTRRKKGYREGEGGNVVSLRETVTTLAPQEASVWQRRDPRFRQLFL